MSDIVSETSQSVEATKRLAASLASCAQPGDVFVLSGDLGAGKTQFSQGFARGLGIDEPVTSPTFNLVFEYPKGRIPLYHFDLYRLDDIAQLDDIAFYELLDGEGVSLVEWGEKFLEAFDGAYVLVRIVLADDGSRVISIEPNGQRAHDLVHNWLAENSRATE